MSDNAPKEVSAKVLRTYPDGRTAVSVPNMTGEPSMSNDHSVCCLIDNEENVESIFITISFKEIRKYADWLARHGMIERQPNEVEISTVMRTIASTMHKIVDNFYAYSGRLFAEQLGENMDNPDRVADVLQSVLFDSIMDEARTVRGLRPEHSLEVEKGVVRLLQERLTFDALGEVNISDVVDQIVSGKIDGEAGCEEVVANLKNITSDILDELVPDPDPVGIVLNLVRSQIPKGTDSEVVSDFMREAESVVSTGYENNSPDTPKEILELFKKHGIKPVNMNIDD